MAGLASTDWTWTIKFGDYDCDGLVDVFTTNGVGRNMNDSDLARQHKQFVENQSQRHREYQRWF